MGRTDRAEAFAAAPPEAVWAVLTDPARLAAWLPPEGMEASVEAWEPWPGGRLRVVLTYRDAAGAPGRSTPATDVVAGRFTQAERPWRLSWATRFDGPDPALAGEMTMTWRLSRQGAGTRIVLLAEGVPDAIRPEDHAEGLGATLRQLAQDAALRR